MSRELVENCEILDIGSFMRSNNLTVKDLQEQVQLPFYFVGPSGTKMLQILCFCFVEVGFGTRAYFLSGSGQKCQCLYRPPGEKWFKSRSAYDLSYYSQKLKGDFIWDSWGRYVYKREGILNKLKKPRIRKKTQARLLMQIKKLNEEYEKVRKVF